MSTRSTIALEFADGSVSQVYCHFDGYLANNGQLLESNYMDPFKVRSLVDLGDFSCLRETVEETAEGRYKDGDNSARRYMNTDEYFDTCQQEEYDYLMRNVDGVAVWFVRCYATDGVWATMGEARMNEAKMEEGAY